MAMNVLTMDELKALAAPQEGKCISIYMPTVDKSQQVRQNFIRYKNLLDDAADQLKKAGIENAHIQKYIARAQSLIDEETFWEQQQDRGLAVFLSKNTFQTHQLPEEVDEIAVVNDHFYLKPLLRLLYKGGEFYILALSQNEARLIKATEHSAEEVEVPHMPKSMDEALPDVTSPNDTSFHTNSAEPGGKGVGGERPAMFYGYGRGEEDKKKNLSKYFHKVDDAVAAYLGSKLSPLIIAGVEYFLPIYREANTYEHFVDEIIPGNHDGVRPEQLRDSAWPKVGPIFHDAIDEISGRYKQLAGWKDQRATKDLKEVVKAAPYSRVEVLFVDKNAKKWGKFDPENLDVKFEDQQSPENEDLVDFAAVQTLLNGGTVYVVDPQEMPEQGAPVAAIFRY